MTATLKTTIIQEPSSLTPNIQLGTSGQVGLGGANFGNANQVIVSGGASAAPSWANKITVTESVFESSGTYTPNANGVYYEVIAIGGGAASSNASGSANASGSSSGGGGGGGAIVGFTKSEMGNTAVTVTVGAGGNNGSPGNAGGTTSFGTFISAAGGSANGTGGAITVNAGTANFSRAGNAGASGSNGGFSIPPYSFRCKDDGQGAGSGAGGVTASAGQNANGNDGFRGIVVVREYL